MDSGTIIVTIVFLAIVILPFVLTGYSRGKKKKSLFCKLTEMAQNDNFIITYHQFCGDFVIGLDETASRLFFYKKRDNIEIAENINLKDFQSCSILSSKRTVNTKKEHYYVIDKLNLCLYPSDRNKPNVLVEIYNDEYDSLTLSGELQLVEKWKMLINERLKNLKNSKICSNPENRIVNKKPELSFNFHRSQMRIKD